MFLVIFAMTRCAAFQKGELVLRARTCASTFGRDPKDAQKWIWISQVQALVDIRGRPLRHLSLSCGRAKILRPEAGGRTGASPQKHQCRMAQRSLLASWGVRWHLSTVGILSSMWLCVKSGIWTVVLVWFPIESPTHPNNTPTHPQTPESADFLKGCASGLCV